MKRTTIITHTFKRPEAIKALTESIATYYPAYIPDYFLVNDDTDKDNGVSWGRNFLISQAQTEFVLCIDDDFIFTENTNIEKLEYLMDTTDYDIIGFECGSDYLGSFVIDGTTVHQVSQKNQQGNYDYIPQIFIARREVLVKHPWDPTLKIGEHFPFFFEHLGKIKVGYTNEVSILHKHINPGNYKEYRKRGWDYGKEYMRRKGITKKIRGKLIIEV